MQTTTTSAERTVRAVPRVIRAEPAARPRDHRRLVAAWFWSGATLTFLILVTGGITRLTQSGLSIVDWRPIMGVIPPLGESQWLETFERYRQFPEYQQLRVGMTLEEFKFIFFWEYFHRMLARLVGLVFLVPFLFFSLKRYLDRRTMLSALVLFGLGALQGFLGWFLVSSGLIDRPYVSHYRLAIHLTVAFTIFGCCVWFALDQRARPHARATLPRPGSPPLGRWLGVVGGILIAQVIWGALVAGLKAGYIYNTFPLMADSIFPTNAWTLDPLARNLVENPGLVQWMHRVLGTVLGLATIMLALRVRSAGPRDRRTRRLSSALWVLILSQYLLGVLTLLLRVPVPLGVLHQGMAMIVFGVWVAWLHHWRELCMAPGGVSPA